jgi:hypothetical protein
MMQRLRKRHWERNQLPANGIEREPHGFKRVSTEKRAIFLFAKNDRGSTDTILVLEQRNAYLSFDGLAIRQTEGLHPQGIDPKPL